MKQLLTARITRVDEATQTVHGVVAEEVTDKTGKLKFDYEKSKPHFEQWIAERYEASNGVSKGNLREMHQPLAAGLFTDWEFDDDARVIRGTAKVVDPLAWAKVVAGVYTGFSIGGDYAGPLWADPVETGVKRFAAKPYETSLVDNPQMWGTNFDFTNAAGVHETRTFRGGASAMKGSELVRTLVTEGTRRLAQLRGTGVDESAKCIRGMWSVGRLAELIESLEYLCSDARWEAEYEADGSTVPAQLAATLAELGAILVAMAAEETAELTAKYLPPPDADLGAVAMALGTIAASPTLQRAASADKKLKRSMQKIHDSAVECGASCSTSKVSMALGTGNEPAREGDDMTDQEFEQKLTRMLLGPQQPEQPKEGLLTRALGNVLKGDDFTRTLGETVKGTVESVLKPEIERTMTAIGEVKTVTETLVTGHADLERRLKVLEWQPSGGQQLPLVRAAGAPGDPTAAAASAAAAAAAGGLPAITGTRGAPEASRALIKEAFKKPLPLSSFEVAA